MKTTLQSILLLSFCSLSTGHGATIIADAADAHLVILKTAVVSGSYDAGVNGTDAVSVSGGTSGAILQVGSTTGNTELATCVIPFLIPTLSIGQSFANVSFTLRYNASSGANAAADLYGLGRRDTATILLDDYYVGPSGGDTTDATRM